MALPFCNPLFNLLALPLRFLSCNKVVVARVSPLRLPRSRIEYYLQTCIIGAVEKILHIFAVGAYVEVSLYNVKTGFFYHREVFLRKAKAVIFRLPHIFEDGERVARRR